MRRDRSGMICEVITDRTGKETILIRCPKCGVKGEMGISCTSEYCKLRGVPPRHSSRSKTHIVKGLLWSEKKTFGHFGLLSKRGKAKQRSFGSFPKSYGEQ